MAKKFMGMLYLGKTERTSEPEDNFCNGGTCGFIDSCRIEEDGICRKAEDEADRAAALADDAYDRAREDETIFASGRP